MIYGPGAAAACAGGRTGAVTPCGAGAPAARGAVGATHDAATAPRASRNAAAVWNRSFGSLATDIRIRSLRDCGRLESIVTGGAGFFSRCADMIANWLS